jgi:hypothetical protein
MFFSDGSASCAPRPASAAAGLMGVALLHRKPNNPAVFAAVPLVLLGE